MGSLEVIRATRSLPLAGDLSFEKPVTLISLLIRAPAQGAPTVKNGSGGARTGRAEVGRGRVAGWQQPGGLCSGVDPLP